MLSRTSVQRLYQRSRMTQPPNAPTSKPLTAYYGNAYYSHSCGGNAPYQRDEPAWVAFFGRIADRLVSELAPRSVLDAGCAIGLLVEALRDRDVEAWGLDFSDYAIGQVRADLRPFCWVGSITEDLDRDFDLITCIEVLEHLPAEQAEVAVANLTNHTDRILFSSTPDDFQEPTHINVQPPEYWAGLFALHGFYRDLDFDASFVARHAVLFRRQRGALTPVIRGYERWCNQLTLENRELRAAHLAVAEAAANQRDGEVQILASEPGPVASSETERRLIVAVLGAGRLAAPTGTRRRQVLHSVITGAVDALDWAYVRVRRPVLPDAPRPVAARAMPTPPQPQPTNGLATASALGEPLGKIDGPAPGASARVVTLLWGWALDRASTRGAGVTAVRVYLDGVWKGTATYGISRHDVAEQFGRQFTQCGWEFALDLQNVSPGLHTVQVAAYSSVAGQETTYSQSLSVQAPPVAPTTMRFALFISGCPGDPKRYRCDHQAQQLQLLGITADVGVYGEVTLGDVVNRYHVFVLHRVLLSQDVVWFVDEAHRRGHVVVYDTDDLVFDLEATPFIATLDRLTDRERENFLDSVARGRQALVSCDAVLVSTEPLQEIASRIHTHVVVSPNVVDRTMLDQARAALRYTRVAEAAESDEVTIAYLCGTPTHNRDFLEVADALIWALENFPRARLVTVGPLTLDARFQVFGDRVEQLPLRPWGQLAELIGDVDVSLAPLEPDNPFTQAKSCIKYFEAALVGVPTIASPLPDFARVIVDGVNGVLASDTTQWQAALARLIESAELRREIGQRARQDVLEHHTTAASALGLLSTFRQLVPSAADDLPLTINWVVRAPSDRSAPVLSRAVSRLAGYLSRRGHGIRFWVEPRAGGPDYAPDAYATEVQRYAGPVAIETVVGRSKTPLADVNIATDASTAHLVAAHGASTVRAYFVEDGPSVASARSAWESLFLPLRMVCFGQPAAEGVAELTGGPCVVVEPPADDADETGWAAAGAQLERVLLEMAFVGRVDASLDPTGVVPV
jgi:glycosyltransferase involved in cell wall biosynthesis/SAM-dependent methyltransferase